MTRYTGIAFFLLAPFLAPAQDGDLQLRAKADQLFAEQRYAEAMPLYSQLVSLSPSDRTLNYRFGACLLHGSADKEQAIGHLRFATDAPTTEPFAWYWLGRAYHLNYRFKDAQAAYQRFQGTADKRLLAQWPVEALMKQCRNGEKLLANLKDIAVRSKVEVPDADFFRFYDLSDIGGRIVVLPDELKTSLDNKRRHRSLVHLPQAGGTIYFSSYGKDGATGLDIYSTQLLPNGTYAPPVKLAGYINTDQDEDFPFMHPDRKTFFFCSKGH
ncbi:MAG: tetratricopeptide repeat protein, partial [Flavobacteriales bacterium]